MGDIIISWEMVKQYIYRRNVCIVDLRSKADYEKEHISKAINLQYESLIEWLEMQEQEMIYIFYCDKGNTSMDAAKAAQKRGWVAYSVSGGFNDLVK